jgi:hypothetical protein
VIRSVSMGPNEPNELQTLMLWALLGRGGSALAKDIKPKIEKKDRERLVERGLVEATKIKQAFQLEVTDEGWAWAGKNLAAPLPSRSTAGAAILQAWLERLGVYLRATATPLSDVLATRPESHEDSHPDTGALRDRIRAAYLQVTGGSFNRRALLRDVRVRLDDIDRQVLDAALLRMQIDDDAALLPLDNRAEITDTDRAAAIQIGAEQRHILWIER